MRRREIFDLDWSNVDMGLGVIYILQSKTRQKRIVPMSDNLKALLLEIGPKKSGKVFTMKVSAFESAFKRAKDKAGLKGLTFHDLRHSCAGILISSGVPLLEVQQWLGHSTYQTTADLYVHLDFSTKLKSSETINTILEKE